MMQDDEEMAMPLNYNNDGKYVSFLDKVVITIPKEEKKKGRRDPSKKQSSMSLAGGKAVSISS